MDYWNIVKYVLMTVLAVILAVSAIFGATQVENNSQPAQPIQQQQNQSKFNF